MRVVFEWLDAHPGFYWLGAGAATTALLAWIAAGLRASAPDDSRRRAGEWVFSTLLLLFLIAWRWPYLFCASEYNPDESQFIAGAMALARDPVFWRSVDGVTSGPLDFYALLPLHWLGVPLDYFGARLSALVLTWLTLLLVHRTLRAETSPGAARLALLPSAVFFGAASAPDFVHYSSELAPLALLALAVHLGGRSPLAAALVAGCLPWAKLQAAPLAVAVVGWQLWCAWRTRPGAAVPWRRSAVLLAGAAVPSLLVLGLVAAFGQWEHFHRRFILQNIAYVGRGNPAGEVLRDMIRFARESVHFFPWLWAVLFFLAAGTALHFGSRGAVPARSALPARCGYAALLCGAAVLCIITPLRASLHYLFFLSVPATLATGLLLAGLWTRPAVRRPVVALALGCALAPLAVRARQPHPPMIGQLADHWIHPYTAVGQVLRHWHRDQAHLALWGWMSFAYVEGGLPQATRDTVSQWCILDVRQRDYYRATFLDDMERNRPEVFVDAVGPGSPFFFNRPAEAHEIFPALAERVRRDYHLVVDLQSARVYVRKDFLARHPLSNSELQRLVGLGRLDYGLAVPPAATRPEYLPSIRTEAISGTILEPPGEMQWHLDGTERSLRLNFAMHPKAYTEGDTDGAEIIAELRMPGQPPLQVLHRLLNPRVQAGDRGPLSGEADLPPYPPGTDLVVRTTAGQAGNTAWDWVCVNALRFSHSPFFSPRQFPGFRRVPSKIEVAYPYIVREGEASTLVLPPPAALTFVLEGNERQFNFTYGLAPGAYTGPGQTDGAAFIADLEREGAPVRNLFTRRIEPLGYPAHRGDQYADLMLPADIKAGDRIVLRIEAGGNTSWDWTYLRALELR